MFLIKKTCIINFCHIKLFNANISTVYKVFLGAMAFATASFVTAPVVAPSVPPLQHTAFASQSLWQFQFDRECLIWAVLTDFEFCSTRYLQRNINLVNHYSL